MTITPATTFKDLPDEKKLLLLTALTKLQSGKLTPAKEKTHTTGGFFTGSHGGTAYVACKHAAEKIVFSHEGRNFYGALRMDVDPCDPGIELIIDLTGTGWVPYQMLALPIYNGAPYGPMWLQDIITELDGSLGYKLPRPNIRFNWPDMKPLPGNSPVFWEKLLTICPEGDIVFCCQGGHGRTGTALVSMLMCAKRIGVEEAVDLVRKEYCHKAVETKEQMNSLYTLQDHWRPDISAEEAEAEKTKEATKTAKKH